MYGTILLAYDGSREGRLALREGARLAQICGSRVVLLAVVDVTVGVTMAGMYGPFVPPYQPEDFRTILDEGAERLTRMGLDPQVRLETGQPVERITAVAKMVGADLVVVGHHQLGTFSRWFQGSVTAALSDRLECSLLSARLEISDEVLFGEGNM